MAAGTWLMSVHAGTRVRRGEPSSGRCSAQQSAARAAALTASRWTAGAAGWMHPVLHVAHLPNQCRPGVASGVCAGWLRLNFSTDVLQTDLQDNTGLRLNCLRAGARKVLVLTGYVLARWVEFTV